MTPSFIVSNVLHYTNYFINKGIVANGANFSIEISTLNDFLKNSA